MKTSTSRMLVRGNGLPGRWAERNNFVVLDSEFGTGEHFLATWAAWLEDPQRCRRLCFIAIAAAPPSSDELSLGLRDGPTPHLAAELVDAWPELTPNLHRLEFEQGRVQLLLVIGALADGLRELVADVDAFYLGGFVPAAETNGWQARHYKGFARLAGLAATAASPATDLELHAGLRSAGFETETVAAEGDTDSFSAARFAPQFFAKRPPARRRKSGSKRPGHALVLGAGLAGCATAAALAEHGWTCTLVDRHLDPAGEASGNTAGVFHGVVHAHDGHHARFNRAAALEAGRTFKRMLASDLTGAAGLGEVKGLLRLGSKLPDLAAMKSLLLQLGLPEGHVRAVDAEQASVIAGIALRSPAWFYPDAGWMRPAALAQAWLNKAAAACTFARGLEVAAIRQVDGQWILLNRDGAQLAVAPTLVLANAAGAQPLLDGLSSETIDWPCQRVRGQTSQIPLDCAVTAPRIPLSGAGYLLPAIDGNLMFGATAHGDDDCAVLRLRDHQDNLARMAGLSPQLASTVDSVAGLAGRVGWRCVASDRLPLIGAVPAAWAGGQGGSWDQARFVTRQPGLFLFTALGSRGITWSPLGSQVLAAMIAGAAIPLESTLLDAVDPARFLSRANRKPAPGQAAAPS